VGDLDSFEADFMGQTGRKASANYVVDRDGTIYQFVDPDDAAWTHGDTNAPRTDLPWLAEQQASGNTDMNMSAIGIEIVNGGNGSNPGSQDPADFEPYTPEQIAAVKQLTNYLVQRYGIPPTRDHLLGHSDINTVGKSDPGPLFPWQEVITSAGGSF
jgi:N-acetyl-anhydromuramyl-L-alanine amidase AmpD